MNEADNASIKSVYTVTYELDLDCIRKGKRCNMKRFYTRYTTEKDTNLAKQFRLTGGYFFMRPWNKSKYGLLMEIK